MFKVYNLDRDLQSHEEVDTECNSGCLYTLLEDEEWQNNEDRYYELEICGCENEKVLKNQEERVYTQIRKVQIMYLE
jgi:hypothetical protein